MHNEAPTPCLFLIYDWAGVLTLHLQILLSLEVLDCRMVHDADDRHAVVLLADGEREPAGYRVHLVVGQLHPGLPCGTPRGQAHFIIIQTSFSGLTDLTWCEGCETACCTLQPHRSTCPEFRPLRRQTEALEWYFATPPLIFIPTIKPTDFQAGFEYGKKSTGWIFLKKYLQGCGLFRNGFKAQSSMFCLTKQPSWNF